MCLIVQDIKNIKLIDGESYIYANIAKEDIVCYKIMGIHLDAYIQEFFYLLNELHNNPTFPDHLSVKNLIIEKGAFHSYDDFDIVKDIHARLGFIVECIIPNGAKYYKGYHNNQNFTGYASNQIIPKKIITVSDKRMLYTLFVGKSLGGLNLFYNRDYHLDIPKNVISCQQYIDYLNNRKE